MIRNTLKIECFLESLANYLEIKSERDEARAGYQGYSWGYYGQPYEDRLAIAAAEVEDRLLAVVKQPEPKQCPTCGDHDCKGGLPCETGDGV